MEFQRWPAAVKRKLHGQLYYALDFYVLFGLSLIRRSVYICITNLARILQVIMRPNRKYLSSLSRRIVFRKVCRLYGSAMGNCGNEILCRSTDRIS